MTIIGLKSLKLYGYHGVHAEERVLGGHFNYQVKVEIEEVNGNHTDQIQDTLDYTRLIAIVKEIHATPQNLLEYLAESISKRIRTEFQEVMSISVEIEKLKPPVPEDIHAVFVRNEWKRALK